MKNLMYLILCKFIQIHGKSNTFLYKIKMDHLGGFYIGLEKNKFFCR